MLGSRTVLIGALGMAAASVADAAETLTVGAVESLTGPVATAGIPNACGLQVARDALEARGLPRDHLLTLRILDDQSKPAVAVQQASKLTGDGVRLFVGGTSTSTVLASLPILKDADALYTGGTTKADQLFDAGNKVVRINSNAGQDGAAIAEYVTGKLGAKKLAFVALQGAYADSVLASLKGALGGKAAIDKTYITPADAMTFQSTITSLAADKPDAVLLAMFGQSQIVAFMRQYKQAGVDVPLVVTPGLLFPGVARSAGGAAEGVVSADLWTDGLDTPANRDLKAAFATFGPKHGDCANLPLDKQIAVSYGQLVMLAEAIDKAGSTDPATLLQTIKTTPWDLPQGRVTFDERGQARIDYTPIVGRGDTVVPLR